MRDDELPMWRDWANRYLDAFQDDLDEDQLVLMHAIVPERDLPVYQIGGEWVTLKYLATYISERRHIAIFDEFLSVNSTESLSEHDLNAHFTQDDACVILPKMIRYRRDFLNIPSVQLPSYIAIISEAVKGKWHAVKTKVVDDFPVGSVLGQPILRQVTLLSNVRSDH